ncbi:MAG TPA: polysaccharide deacetylase family protein [Firmicutes bacterium]|nr:polysaccharide deacetylase family protein [Bacillota bacterium]
MKRIQFDLFPHGKRKAVTFSYDDGQIFDTRLAEMFDKYGVKCTFNLNSDNLGKRGYVDASFVRELSARHEIACHTLTHPHLENLPLLQVTQEIYEDKCALEDITGKPVCGMAYPFGTYNEGVKRVLRSVEILYSRTTGINPKFTFPQDDYEWHPNCHHRNAAEKAEQFLGIAGEMSLMYIWGHSFEFDREKNWEFFEHLLGTVAGHDDIWYATNLELYDYRHAVQSLRISAKGESVFNPSALTVYASVDGVPTAFAPGLTKLKRMP